jgi:hypothetical protein
VRLRKVGFTRTLWFYAELRDTIWKGSEAIIECREASLQMVACPSKLHYVGIQQQGEQAPAGQGEVRLRQQQHYSARW